MDESALTGESLTVGKHTDALPKETVLADRKNMAFMGTTISSGRGLGLVVATGMKTELGKIASNIAETQTPKTPLELKQEPRSLLGFRSTHRRCAVGFVEPRRFVRQTRCGPEEVAVQQFIVAIAIFVAIVPEGLPIILVITLSLGMRNMARHKAIIRRMKAVETLGSTTVICSDKTGTLTKNQMTVRLVHTLADEYNITGEGFEPNGQLIPKRRSTVRYRPQGPAVRPWFPVFSAHAYPCVTTQTSFSPRACGRPSATPPTQHVPSPVGKSTVM